MTPAPARLGLWFALTLALPAAFAAAWVWLVPGGVVARAEADERRSLEQALTTGAEELLRALQAAADAAELPLQLDEGRFVVAPFVVVEDVPAALAASIAEQAAVARMAAGDVDGALPFFAHAAADGSLTPQGWLRYVDARAVADPKDAKELLSEARTRHASARCGPLPFELLALLAEARWMAVRAEQLRASWGEQFVAAVRQVPAAAVPVVLDELAATSQVFDEGRIDAIRAAAAAAARHRELAVLPQPAPEPDQSVLVPIDDAHCAAVPPGVVQRLRTECFASVRAREPGVRLLVASGEPGDGANRAIAALGETWAAVPTSTPTSVLLTIAARTSLVLALATLVLGNLLLWRLTRRESQLVRLRSDFVDVVSHELRTPLTALSLKAEMLAAGDVPPERRAHYLHGLHHDVLRLTDQVERILDFGRLQRGAPLRRERVPARGLLAKGLRAGRPALRLVCQQLEVEAPRALPPIVGDVEVLSRALRNLLENAAKYAPAGSTVAVRAFAQGGELIVEVADRGPGVPAGDRGSIFQPFVRGSAASSATPGSGLGLALVAAAASSHGGRVTVGERPGGGSVFTLRLPIDERHTDEGAAS